MAKMSFKVTVDVPTGVSSNDMSNYILKEIQAGIGALSADNPLSNMDCKSVEVVKIFKPKVIKDY
ncbi:MAG: hypothetical protein ACRDBG_23520 [Waterburya sp.]